MDEANKQFNNLQLLFDYINSRPEWNANVRFGTLADYFGQVKQSKHTFPVLTGDFFTYADRQQDFWSGYYVSRSHWKLMDRQVESLLRASEMMHALSDGETDTGQWTKLLADARDSLALFQHHG
jgi:alpha-mannosidase II